jgi:ribosomal protein S27AE
MGPRQAPCPNCGGPIELKLGASHACVCPYCRFAVVRTDRDLQSIGKVSDLVPTAPELTTGDRAYFEGDELVVGGRLQLDHGRGPWDEFYVASSRTQSWGWLAKAQGRWYLTAAVVTTGPVPSWDSLRPGSQGPFLPGIPGMWSVAEQGQSRTLSAEGELPYPVRGGEQGWYVDLEGPSGAFATIDYGDGRQAPTVFVGRTLSPDQLRIERSNPQRPTEKIDTSRLRCPSCGAPVPLLVPDRAERAGCGHCGALLDYDKGAFRVLAAMEKARSRALIPLGKEGTLLGEKVVCLAFMERATWVDGQEFRWREYLLYSEEKGYRWLMEDNGHWTWMAPVSSGDIQLESGVTAQHAGRRHRVFSRQNVSVVSVVGELYWKVEAGETTYTSDYIAPPFMLSGEQSSSEINWSLGRYVEPGEIQKAFGLEGPMPTREGVGFCQPNPHSLKVVGIAAALLLPLLCVLFVFFELSGQHPHVASLDVTMPPVPGPYEAAPPVRSIPFTIDRGPTTLRVDLQTNAQNQYVGIDAALVSQSDGQAHHFYVETGYYSGNDGESWSEGAQSTTVYVDRIKPGPYVVELVPLWESHPQPGGPTALTPPNATVNVFAHERSPVSFCCSFVLLLIPLAWTFFRRSRFETRRNENANL